MKKKLLTIILACALAFSMSACGSEELGQLKDTLSDLSENLADESVQDDLQEALDALEALESVMEEMENETSSAESEVAELGTFTFDIPTGFIETSAGYYAPESGLESSSINYLTQPNDGSFYQVDGQVFAEAIAAQFKSTQGVDVTISVLNEEFYEINGVDAFKYTIEYELLGFNFVQTQVIVNDPETFHFVTCTVVNDEDYKDTFESFLDTLRFE